MLSKIMQFPSPILLEIATEYLRMGGSAFLSGSLWLALLYLFTLLSPSLLLSDGKEGLRSPFPFYTRLGFDAC